MVWITLTIAKTLAGQTNSISPSNVAAPSATTPHSAPLPSSNRLIALEQKPASQEAGFLFLISSVAALAPVAVKIRIRIANAMRTLLSSKLLFCLLFLPLGLFAQPQSRPVY